MFRKLLIVILISFSLAIAGVETARLCLPFPPMTFAASKSLGNVLGVTVMDGSAMVSLGRVTFPYGTDPDVRLGSTRAGFGVAFWYAPIGAWVRVPLWFVCAMLMMYPSLAFTQGPIRRWWRRRHGRCEVCCYDLQGLPEARCPECGTSTLPEASAKWKWRRQGVVAGGVVVMVIIAAFGAHLASRRYANAPWETYYEQLHSAGEPLTLQEIEAGRPTIPDHENGALLLLQLADELDGEVFETTEPVLLVRKDSSANQQLVWAPRADVEPTRPKTNLRKLDLFEGIPRSTLEPTRRFVQDRVALFGKLERLKNMPSGRLPLAIDPLMSPLDVMLPSLNPWKNAAKLERLNALTRLLDGDVEGALEATRSQFRIAATLSGEATVIARLVESYCIREGVRSLELILQSTELDLATCGEFIELFDRHLANSSWKTPLLFERACTIELFNRLAAGEPLSSDGDTFTDTDRAYPMLYQIRQSQVRATWAWTSLIEAIGDPRRAVVLAGNIESRRRTEIWAGQDERLERLAPSVEFLMEGMASNVVQLRAAKVALACERFRLTHGRWPETLTDLVPEFLPSVPLDALGDRPIRMRTIFDVLCIYSVGTNRVGDGCKLYAPEGKFRPLDIGFRLLDPADRGLVILDDEATVSP